MPSFFFYLCMVLFLFVSLILILLVLVQKGRGGGLASAFGGAGGNTAFGAKTGDVLTWATSVIFGIFLLLAVACNLLADRIYLASTGPVAPAAPVTPQSNTTPAANPTPTPQSEPLVLPPSPSTLPAVPTAADLKLNVPATTAPAGTKP